MSSDKVKRYAPVLYADNSEMQALYTVQAQLYNESEDSGGRLFRNRFIVTADISAIKEYEKLYGVLPDSSVTLQERRLRIIDKIIFRPPFTRHRLQEILDKYFGKGTATFSLNPDRYELTITLDTEHPMNYFKYQEHIRKLLPANIKIMYDMQFTYIYLEKNMTHALLRNHTYGGLSRFANSMYTIGDTNA